MVSSSNVLCTSINIRRFFKEEIDIFRRFTIGGVSGAEVHIQTLRLGGIVEGQIDLLGCTNDRCASEHFVIGGNLLPHDDNLVPLGVGGIADGRFEACRRIDEGVAIAPHKIDFTEFGHQPLIRGIRLQSTGD